MTPEQCRAARALLRISQDDLVRASGVAKATIAAFELGQRKPYARTIAAIRAALEAAGVEFIAENGGGAGVRLVRDVPVRWLDDRTLITRFRGRKETFFVTEMREEGGIAISDRRSPETDDRDLAEEWLETGDFSQPKRTGGGP